MWPEGSFEESSTATCESRSNSFSRRFEASASLSRWAICDRALVPQLREPLEILLEPLEDDRQVHRDITMTSQLVSVKHQSAVDDDIAAECSAFPLYAARLVPWHSPAVPVEVLEHVLGALLEGVLVVDAAGRRVYANEEAARLTGYPSARPCSRRRRTRRPPASSIRDRVREADRRRRSFPAAGSSPARTTARCSSASASGDGPERVSEVRSVADPRRRRRERLRDHVLPRGDRAGQSRRIRSRRCTSTPQQTTALLDALYQSAPVGLGFWDRELRYVRVNEALARINERSARGSRRPHVPRGRAAARRRPRGDRPRRARDRRGGDRARDRRRHADEPGRAPALVGELLPGHRARR